MKKIIVNRQKGTANWTLSTFEADDKCFSGVGVEDEKREIKVFGETRIDAGEYRMILAFSPKFSPKFYRDDQGNLIHHLDWDKATPAIKLKYYKQHEGMVLVNVPKFDGIMWHCGATDIDTHGCYIIGSKFGKIGDRDGVLGSKEKYMEIYPHIYRAFLAAKGKYNITVQYIDHE